MSFNEWQIENMSKFEAWKTEGKQIKTGGGGFAEFGKGLVDAYLLGGKGALGTVQAVAGALPTEKEMYELYGFDKPTDRPLGETKVRPFVEAQRRIEAAREPFQMTHAGVSAKAGRILGNAIGYMSQAMAGGYTVGPVGAAIVGFNIEGQSAYDDAIATGATEQQAQQERLIVGSINAGIEALQIGRLMKFQQAGKHSLKNFIRLAKQRAYKRMLQTGKQFGSDILRHSIEEGLEEFAQEGVSVSVPALFRGEYPKKENGTIDLWALGERLGSAFAGGMFAGGVLGTAGQIQLGGKQRDLITKGIEQKVMSFEEWQNYKPSLHYGETNIEIYDTLEKQKQHYQWYIEDIAEKLRTKVSESIPEALDTGELLGYGHAIPEALGMKDEERWAYNEALVGKRSMSDMNPQELEDLMWQLRQDADAAGVDLNKLAQKFQPLKELNKQLQSLRHYRKPRGELAERRRSGILKAADWTKAKVESYLLRQDRMKNICRMLDGYKKDGPMSRLIFEPNKAAQVKAKDNANQLMYNLRRSAEEHGIDIGKMFDRKAAPEIVKGAQLSDSELAGIYYLAQNPKARKNIEAMFKEDGINPTIAIETINDYVEKNDDLMYVYRDARAYFDTMGPRFFDVVKQLEIKGVVPEQNYITMLLNKGDEEGTADILADMTEQFGLTLPGKKHVKERTGAVRRMNMDLFSITAQASRSLERFINVAPVVKKVNTLIEKPSFKENLNATTKGQGVKIFKKWLADSARGRSDVNMDSINRTATWLRRNAVLYTLGAKIFTVVPKQAISGFNAAAKRPAMIPTMLKNINRMADPRVSKQLEERAVNKSKLVKNRDWERDLRKVWTAKDVKRFFKGKKLSPIAMRSITWMDRKTVTLVWNSAYDLALADGLEEMQARKYADDMVQTTQPMAGTEDLPDFFRGGPVAKALTTFMNQRNQNWQFLRHDILGEKTSKSLAMYRFLFSQILPSMMLGMITRGRLPEDAKEMALDLTSYIVTPQIFLGRFIYNIATGEWRSSTFAAVSALPLRGFEETEWAAKALQRGDYRKAAERGVGAVGAFTGKIPQQVITTTGGVIDLAIGETDDYKRLIYSEYMIEKYGEKPKKGLWE